MNIVVSKSTGWFRNLKIRNKFMVISVIILFFLIGLSGAGLWGVTQINTLVEDLNSQQVPEIVNISEAFEKIQATRSYVNLAILENTTSQIQTQVYLARQKMKTALQNLQTFTSASHSTEPKELVSNIETEAKTWQAETEKLLDLANRNSIQADQEALAILEQANDQKLTDNLGAVIDIDKTEVQAKKESATVTYFTVTIIIIACAVGVLLVVIGAMFILGRSVTNPLAKLRSATQVLATGNLRTEVDFYSQDELGELSQTFNSTIYSLRDLVKQLYAQSQIVTSATIELTSQAKNQVVGSTQQSQELTEATQALEELSKTTQAIAQQVVNATEAVGFSLSQAYNVSKLADQMAFSQERGRATVARTIAGLHNLKAQVVTIEAHQQALVEQSFVIQGVVELIDRLAKETHLLALNAAIEAAGAGSFGNRFAVIAAEVKRLADSSVEATKEVSVALSGIASGVEKASLQTRRGLEEAEQAVAEANNCDEVLRELTTLSQEVKDASREIVVQVQHLALLATNIGTATTQQQFSSSQVLEKMVEIEKITSFNLDTLKEGEHFTYELSHTVREIEHLFSI